MAMTLLFVSPWLAGIVWYWRTTPREGLTFPSLADQARSRI
jgi:hypothetical protein